MGTPQDRGQVVLASQGIALGGGGRHSTASAHEHVGQALDLRAGQVNVLGCLVDGKTHDLRIFVIPPSLFH